MKYIRTKDGTIHEVFLKRYNVYFVKENPSDGSDIYGDLGYSQEDIIKEADKIEELSDCFIAIDKNGCLCEDPMVSKGRGFKSFCNYYKANHMDVDCYLAILTNKGLIFVAKMNQKGAVELL